MLRTATQVARRVLASGAAPPAHVLKPAAAAGAVRFLNVHEHVGMTIMKKYDIPVPKYKIAKTAEEADQIFEDHFHGEDVVIKAQVLAGGRGLGHFDNGFQGGVHVCTKPGQVKEYAQHMLGANLITKQTGAEGKPCDTVLITERVYMRRELYFSILMDRSMNGPVLVGSGQGGTSIEDVAAENPDAIVKVPIDITKGITDEDVQEVVHRMGWGRKVKAEAATAIRNLYRMFLDTDATLVEVNPFAETPDGRVMVCDAKLNFDDNAEFRQKDIFQLRDTTQEDQREVAASKFDLNYIGLDGNIGCMVNGAGLAMATMDIIKLHGGDPANFLDVGGGATAEQVEKAFEILNGDPKVKAILVNIFGGIMRCDVIATGIIQAAGSIGLSKPVVVRLQGTNVEQAKALMESSGYRMLMADDLDDAARKAVKIADIVQQAEKISVGVEFQLPL